MVMKMKVLLVLSHLMVAITSLSHSHLPHISSSWTRDAKPPAPDWRHMGPEKHQLRATGQHFCITILYVQQRTLRPLLMS
jgi:hypothetical protein